MNEQKDDANDTEITLEMLEDLYGLILEEEKAKKKQEEEEASNRIDEAITLARDFYQKGELKKASETAQSILNQDFSKCDGDWNTFAVIAVINQYYLWIEDYREADRLYHKYEKQIEAFDWKEPILKILVDLACEWEAYDMGKSVEYIDKAYQQYQKSKDQEEISFWVILNLKYNYAVFHLKKSPQDKKYVQKLEEVLFMLDGHEMIDKTLEMFELNALYMYLIYTVEIGKYADYIRYIKRYYQLSVTYEQEMGREGVLHRKFACHCMGTSYLQCGNYLLTKHYVQEGLGILCEEENAMCEFFDWCMESNLCALAYFDDSIPGLKDIFKRHYDAVCNKTVSGLVTESDKYLEVARWAELLYFEEKFDDAIKAICKPFEQKILSVSVECSNFILLFNKLLQLLCLTNQKISFLEQHKYIKIIKQIENTNSFYAMNHAVKVQFMAYKTNFIKKYKNKNEIAKVRPVVEKCLQDIDCAMGPYSNALLALISLALEDEKRNDAVFYLEKLQQGWRKQLKRGVLYKKREALLEYLDANSVMFYSIYSAVQKFEAITVEEKYNVARIIHEFVKMLIPVTPSAVRLKNLIIGIVRS